jgi:hypothetical protein
LSLLAVGAAVAVGGGRLCVGAAALRRLSAYHRPTPTVLPPPRPPRPARAGLPRRPPRDARRHRHGRPPHVPRAAGAEPPRGGGRAGAGAGRERGATESGRAARPARRARPRSRSSRTCTALRQGYCLACARVRAAHGARVLNGVRQRQKGAASHRPRRSKHGPKKQWGGMLYREEGRARGAQSASLQLETLSERKPG